MVKFLLSSNCLLSVIKRSNKKVRSTNISTDVMTDFLITNCRHRISSMEEFVLKIRIVRYYAWLVNYIHLNTCTHSNLEVAVTNLHKCSRIGNST